MLGLIQYVLMELVETRGGPGALEELSARVGRPAQAPFRLDTNYSDEECRALFAGAMEMMGLTAEEIFQIYADQFIMRAASLFPVFFSMSHSARDFLLRQPTIHNCLASGLKDEAERAAVGDKFRIEPIEGGLVTHYRSPNRLAKLYGALAQATLRHYGETASIEYLDDPSGSDVRIRILWSEAAPGAATPQAPAAIAVPAEIAAC